MDDRESIYKVTQDDRLLMLAPMRMLRQLLQIGVYGGIETAVCEHGCAEFYHDLFGRVKIEYQAEAWQLVGETE